MKLVIAEYLRTLKERDELDRLLPDLLVEMGYVPIARPQTGPRQHGVDLAARGKNPESGIEELLLAVVKKGDIGRTEWDGGDQSVRQSVNQILDVYLKSHVEPQDKDKSIHIVVVANGNLKQVVQASWCGFVSDVETRAKIEFWGIDHLAELSEKYLLNEHVFHDEERKHLRRALALSGDPDYDRCHLHRLFLASLGLSASGDLDSSPKSGKALFKAFRVVRLSAHAFASWALEEGNGKQSLKGMERAMLWAWHRIQLCDDSTRKKAISEIFGTFWNGYLVAGKNYFERLQSHCYVEDSLLRYCADSSELSFTAFEVVGSLATIGLSRVLVASSDEVEFNERLREGEIVADALASLIRNNGICNSPCLDRHSQDISLALFLLLLTNRSDEAKKWLRLLVRNVDYSYKVKRYVPICTDSLDDLSMGGGWSGGKASAHLMEASWMLAVLGGWSAILAEDDLYATLARECRTAYPDVCVQLWHPDENLYKHLYFGPAQFSSGNSEAPIVFPDQAEDWRDHIRTILESNQARIGQASPAAQAGLPVLDFIACSHFLTPIPPVFWYKCLGVNRS